MSKQGGLATVLALMLLAAGCATPKHLATKLPNDHPPAVPQEKHQAELRLVSAGLPVDPAGSIIFDGSLSVDAVSAYAVANNPEVKAARAKARALGAVVPQVTSLEDPQLSSTAFLDAIETAAGRQEVVLSLSQKFPWFGKLRIRGNVAGSTAQAACREAIAAELKVVEQAKRAYYELYFLEGSIDVNRELEPRLEDVIEIVKAKYRTDAQQTGLETVYQAEIELSELRSRIAELEQARARAQARLLEAMHLGPATQLDVQPALSQVKVPQQPHLLVAMVESCQPELDARRWDIQRNRWAVDLASKEYYPDVTLGANWYGIDSAGISPVADGDDAFSVLVGVNIPIYRGRLNAAVCEARARVTQSCRQYAAEEDQVVADVVALHAEIIEHQRVLGYLQEDILPKSQETLELSVEAYRQDRIDFERLIDTYRDLLRASLRELKQQALREQAIAALERRIGCAATTWSAEEIALPESVQPETLPKP